MGVRGALASVISWALLGLLLAARFVVMARNGIGSTAVAAVSFIAVSFLSPTHLWGSAARVGGVGPRGVGLSTVVELGAAHIRGSSSMSSGLLSQKKKTQQDESRRTVMLLNLCFTYDLRHVLPGAYVTAGVPALHTTLHPPPSAADDDNSDDTRVGIGDVTLALGLGAAGPRRAGGGGLGARVGIKAPTGARQATRYGGAALGSGFWSVHAIAVYHRDEGPGLGVDGQLGLIHTRRRSLGDGIEEDPGDVLYGEVGLSYRLRKPSLQPRLRLVAQARTPVAEGAQGGVLQRLSLTTGYGISSLFDVAYVIDEHLAATITWGVSGIWDGYNMPYGALLVGRNVGAAAASLAVGMSGTW